MITLKHRILLLILAVYVGTGITAYFAAHQVVHRQMDSLGAGYVGKYAMANKALIQEPLTREIALAIQLSQSAAIQKWVTRESDPALRKMAMDELETYRLRLRDKSWFLVVDSSLNYYANDSQNKYAGRERIYSLSSTNVQDAWYFATLGSVTHYALNVNYDRGLDVRKVWINVVIRSLDGKPIGMAGTGLDLTDFIKAFVDRSEPGVTHILLDERLAIQAHRDRSLINEQSVATPDAKRSTIARILQRTEDRVLLNKALDNLMNGSPSETLKVAINGREQLLGVVYIPDLKWYELTLLDFNHTLGRSLFIPLFILIMLVAVVLMGISFWILNSLDETNRALKNTIDQLNEAHSKVKMLAGMLPVCCSCNKIRDEKDNWQTLETYVKSHTDSEFTHGICPECLLKLYPEYAHKLGGK